jgi:membrane-bound serine protease (ClpP class)
MLPLGIVLIALGVILIIGEFFTGSGLLAGMGIICFIAGILFLIFGRTATFQVNWWMLALISVFVIGTLAFIVQRTRTSYRRQVTTGKEDLKGKIAESKTLLNPEGTVLFQGELWNAISISGTVQPGEEVVIIRVDGLKLTVAKVEKK